MNTADGFRFGVTVPGGLPQALRLVLRDVRPPWKRSVQDDDADEEPEDELPDELPDELEDDDADEPEPDELDEPVFDEEDVSEEELPPDAFSRSAFSAFL